MLKDGQGPESALIYENSLFFPCLTGKAGRDGFAPDCLHRQTVRAFAVYPYVFL